MKESMDVLTDVFCAQEYIKNYDCLVAPSLVDNSYGLVALEGIIQPILQEQRCWKKYVELLLQQSIEGKEQI